MPSPAALLHEAADIFLCRAADGEAIDLDGRDADAHGHGLSVFPAGAYAFVEFQIVAHHGNASQNIGAVANQSCAFDRGGDPAIFDHVGLGSGEHKLSVGDVHLAAAEIYCVNAMLDRSNDVARIVFASQHVGVGHARHGDVLVTFAASVAGVRHAHQLGGKFVTQISLQNAFFDQHGVLRGLAFVVHVERAAAPGHGAVIDNGALSLATRLPINPANAEVCLRLKSASSP